MNPSTISWAFSDSDFPEDPQAASPTIRAVTMSTTHAFALEVIMDVRTECEVAILARHGDLSRDYPKPIEIMKPHYGTSFIRMTNLWYSLQISGIPITQDRIIV